jgi:hypothetical protein
VISRIPGWHWGKLVILWAWGGLVVAVLMRTFIEQKPTDDPLTSSINYLGSLAILVALTVITWVWLGGKDNRRR